METIRDKLKKLDSGKKKWSVEMFSDGTCILEKYSINKCEYQNALDSISQLNAKLDQLIKEKEEKNKIEFIYLKPILPEEIERLIIDNKDMGKERILNNNNIKKMETIEMQVRKMFDTSIANTLSPITIKFCSMEATHIGFFIEEEVIEDVYFDAIKSFLNDIAQEFEYKIGEKKIFKENIGYVIEYRLYY